MVAQSGSCSPGAPSIIGMEKLQSYVCCFGIVVRALQSSHTYIITDFDQTQTHLFMLFTSKYYILSVYPHESVTVIVTRVAREKVTAGSQKELEARM